ncbi:MAG: response regulator transcription factor [Chloroflexi bacterium]|nr:response regulator transcription factor [Chloroflexota bacterium]
MTTERKITILVVDDEPHIAEILELSLQGAGYQTVSANDGLEGLQAFFHAHPDLAILDIMMPRMDGIELCRRIREVSPVPVIFLTAKGDVTDRVEGLKKGADYYLPKPVSMAELLAVVEAVLRRGGAAAESVATAYQDAALTINYARREVMVRGERISLSPLEFRLLAFLVQHAGQVFGAEGLLQEVWGSEGYSIDVVRRYISQLRQKIEENPEEPRLIATARGFGYSYESPSP